MTLRERERRDPVLERAQLVDDLGREQIGPRAHHLAELDERRAERAHRLLEHPAAQRAERGRAPRSPDEQRDAESREPVHQAAHEHDEQQEEEVEEVTGPAQHCGPSYTRRGEHVCRSRAASSNPRVFGVAGSAKGADLGRASRGMNTFKADIEEIRRRAREKMEDGAVTASVTGRTARRSSRSSTRCSRPRSSARSATRTTTTWRRASTRQAVAAEFLEHANEEQLHADMVAKRITELERQAELQPGRASRRAATPSTSEGDTLEEMIREDLVAERIAIATYSEIIRWLGERRSDDAPHDRGDPREGGGARRRPREAARRGSASRRGDVD